MDETIPVIFRRWPKTGDVIALFPTIPADANPSLCQSYMRIGQHGASNPRNVIDTTGPATEAQYRDLAAELERIGYRLRVIRSTQPAHRAAREREIARYLPA